MASRQDYAVSLRLEVIEFVRGLPKGQRERIFRWIDHLRFYPLPAGDFEESDASGRPLQVAIIERHAVSYWLDGPVNEVKVSYWLDGPVNEVKVVAIASADGENLEY